MAIFDREGGAAGAAALGAEAVRRASEARREPTWMTDLRLAALAEFERAPTPAAAAGLDLADVRFFGEDDEPWEEVPQGESDARARLASAGVERRFAAGLGAQYESEVVYHQLQADWAKQGIVFLETDAALRERPDLVRRYWGRAVRPEDGKFAALNGAVWAGGSFIYVPRGVRVEVPIQSYFRINAKSVGKFERTIIVVEEGAEVHYVEGCTAPTYSREPLHAAVVEVFVGAGARACYTTLQNWSRNVWSFVEKGALVEAGGTVRWLDATLGGRVSAKRPAARLLGEGARAEVLSLACAGAGQLHDAGARIAHEAPRTTSLVAARALAKNGGRASFRGAVRVASGARGARVESRCDALLLDEESGTGAAPELEVEGGGAAVEHAASVAQIAEDELYYLQSRGIPEAEARVLLVNGFVQPIVKELPMEYAVELARLVQGEMEGAAP
jgi:Fe-S cluster assembly protein SufB